MRLRIIETKRFPDKRYSTEETISNIISIEVIDSKIIIKYNEDAFEKENILEREIDVEDLIYYDIVLIKKEAILGDK